MNANQDKREYDRICYGCLPTYDALLALNLMLRVYNLPIKSVMLSRKPLKVDRREIRSARDLKFLRGRFTSGYLGFLLRFMFLLPFRVKLSNILLGNRAKLYSIKRLQKQFGFELVRFADFNSSVAIDFVSQQDADLFVSLCLDQILKPRFIRLAKCINIHPSLLPDFRGVDPFVQQVLHQRPGGATLHRLTEDVDGGDIYLKKSYLIGKNDRIDDLHFKFIHTAIELLDQFCRTEPTPVPQANATYTYRSWPTRKELKRIPKSFFKRRRFQKPLERPDGHRGHVVNEVDS